MKKIALAFLFCLASSIANAQAFQSNKPLICNSADVIFQTLTETYNEKPVWMAKGEGTQFTLFVNKKEDSWTLVQFTAEVACILGVGKDSRMLLGEPV